MAQSRVNDPTHWRKRAEETRILADETNDPENKRLLLKLLEDYENLAKRAEERSAETTEGAGAEATALTFKVTASSFGPEAIAIITEAYEGALCYLRISPDDEEARGRLAKLMLQIAAEESELAASELLDKTTAAWEWKNLPPQ